jgi:hypothetical protein
MTRRSREAWIALWLLLSVSATAAGQAHERKARPGRYKIGPVYLTPALELRQAGFDSNVYNTESNAVSDAVVVLRPKLNLAFPVGRRLRNTATGALDFNVFRRSRSENSVDSSIEGRTEMDVGPCTLFTQGGLLNARQRFSIEVDERLQRRESWIESGVEARATRRLTVALTGERRVYTYEDLVVDGNNIKDALDREHIKAALASRFRLTPLTTAVATAEILSDDFLRQRDQAASFIRSFRVLGGFELQRRAMISGRALAGVRVFPASWSSGNLDYQGLALAVSVSTPLYRLGQIGLAADRDVLYAVLPGYSAGARLRNAYISTRLRGTLSLDLAFDLVSHVAVGWERAQYLYPYETAAGLVERVDQQPSASVALLRRVGANAQVGLGVSWIRRSSSVAGGGYAGLQYGLQARVTP